MTWAGANICIKAYRGKFNGTVYILLFVFLEPAVLRVQLIPASVWEMHSDNPKDWPDGQSREHSRGREEKEGTEVSLMPQPSQFQGLHAFGLYLACMRFLFF